MELVRDIWARFALAGALVISALVLAATPGAWLFLQELAYNLLRATAAIVMWEGMLRYSTRKLVEGIEKEPPGPVGAKWRFATFFMKMFENPMGIAIFFAFGMLARALIVFAVWK